MNMLLTGLIISDYVFAIDCQNQQTQTDITQCASSELSVETARINKAYNELTAKLYPTPRQKIKEVQLAWIKYKDLACKFEASGAQGGSAYASVLSVCLVEKTKQRSKELEALGNCKEGDLGCPIQ